MKKNLFSKIFHNNLMKGKTPLHKMQDDVGGLIGRFSWKQHDVKTGILLAHQEGMNQVTNVSKSSVMRLLSQGLSPHVGQITPTDYKITKMRFGNAPYANHNATVDKTRAYLDYTEKAYRDNLTVQGGSPSIAGAGGGVTSIVSESGTSLSVNFLISAFGGTAAVKGNTIEINVSNATTFPGIIAGRPPSHATLSVDFNATGPSLLETQTFYNEYSRTATGNPSTRTDVVGGNDIITAGKLVWNASQGEWRLQLTFSSDIRVDSLTDFNVKFQIGTYNIANSIVPKSGSNAGSGTESLRFTDLDYYSISAANVSFSDSPLLNFVDDYSVSFSVTMNGSEGNGVGGNTYPVVYTEAFLFSNNDDLFSVLRFDGPGAYGGGSGTGFVKDDTSSLFLTWTLAAAL